MKVIKKDGRLQDFDLEKIKSSILSATNDSKELLNESDVKILVEDINSKMKEVKKDGEDTSSYEISGIVIAILKRDGFSDIIEKY
ncbi:MAG: ATP cone domain-containing protein, partial [Clostridium sp.]